MEKQRTVGSILKSILDERGIRVRRLAEETGINEQTLYSVIRRGSSKMDIEALLAICKYLGVSPEIFDPETEAEHTEIKPAVTERERELATLIREAADSGVTAKEVRLALDLIKQIKQNERPAESVSPHKETV